MKGHRLLLQADEMTNRLRWIALAPLLTLLLSPALATAQDEVVFFHTDAIGSVRMITDATGAVIHRYDYLPFGEPWDPPPNADVRLFAGKERDSETGLDYVGARYYRAQSGLFLSGDPGHVGADIFNPQSWNAYSYALNNPLRFIDPFGFQACPAPTDTSTCAEGRRGTGDFTLDYVRWMVETWWEWRRQQPIEIGPLITAPLAVLGTTAIRGIGATAIPRSRALTLYQPANNGFLGTITRTTLSAGSMIDRYGGNASSKFFSPVGTPVAARSLPSGVAEKGLRKFEVLKPLQVEAGTVAPAFGQMGFGTQYRTSMELGELIRLGYLREVIR